jgi:ketosteroid isomerase-like protein
MTSVEETQNRLAIRELIDRYTVAVSRRDWDAVAACFHEDGRWRTSVGHDFQGRPAVREGIRAAVEARGFLIQMTHGMTIDALTDDRAETTSVLNEFGAAAAVFVLGLYHDTVTKVDGRWGFAERRFQVHYIDSGPLNGNIVVDYKNP